MCSASKASFLCSSYLCTLYPFHIRLFLLSLWLGTVPPSACLRYCWLLWCSRVLRADRKTYFLWLLQFLSLFLFLFFLCAISLLLSVVPPSVWRLIKLLPSQSAAHQPVLAFSFVLQQQWRVSQSVCLSGASEVLCWVFCHINIWSQWQFKVCSVWSA